MNIIDYLLKNEMDKLYTDESGNIYINEDINGVSFIMHSDYMGTYFLTKEEYDKYNEYNIIIAKDENIGNICNTRRPYYRMRGKSVTEEQAFDITRRTDNFFGSYIGGIGEYDDFLGSMNFDNWLIMQNHYPKGYGWIHVDGTVGGNAITQKYPTVEEFVIEWFKNLIAFPYLDLVIAVTYWDEVPPDVIWDKNERALFKTEAYDERFLDAICLGIYVHGRRIEILNRKDAVAKYKEYDELYGSPREKFIPEYYEESNIVQVDLSYLKRCIESYGLNADEELSKIPEYIWKEKR